MVQLCFRVARENTKVQKESLRVAQALFDAGAVTELDVFQSRGQLRTTEAAIPGFESEIRQVKNALAILLGKLPGEIDMMLAGPKRIPQIPAEIAVGIPAELLRRRPDIRLAERQLAAQSALIGVAKADLFPRLSLFGSIGLGVAALFFPKLSLLEIALLATMLAPTDAALGKGEQALVRLRRI